MLSRFARGHGLDQVPKNVLMGRCNMISATRERSKNDWNDQKSLLQVRRRRGRRKLAQTKKGSQIPDSCGI